MFFRLTCPVLAKANNRMMDGKDEDSLGLSIRILHNTAAATKSLHPCTLGSSVLLQSAAVLPAYEVHPEKAPAAEGTLEASRRQRDIYMCLLPNESMGITALGKSRITTDREEGSASAGEIWGVGALEFCKKTL